MAPHARSYDRLRRGDLDSEGDGERSGFARRVLSTLAAACWRRWRSGELERRKMGCGLPLGRGDATPHVLPDDRGRDRCDVRATVVRRDVRRASCLPMLARPSRGGLGVTPDGA